MAFGRLAPVGSHRGSIAVDDKTCMVEPRSAVPESIGRKNGDVPTAALAKGRRAGPREEADAFAKRAASLRSVPGGPTATSPKRPSVLLTRGLVGDIRDPRLGRLLLPLRVFLGVTFIYAGLVKLADPTFLDPSAPGSLVEQLHAFARDSPLSPVDHGDRHPSRGTDRPLGAHRGALAVGSRRAVRPGSACRCLGRLRDLRALLPDRVMGDAPYFYGPDLPYAAGWLTLALVGDGGLHVLRGRTFGGWPGGAGICRPTTGLPARRAFLETLTVGIAALALPKASALARPSWLRGLLGSASEERLQVASVPGGSAGAAATPAQSAGSGVPSAVSAPTPRPVPNRSSFGGRRGGRLPVRSPSGRFRTVAAAGSATFVVPASGDPGVLVMLANGSIVAFDALCTHAGCPVDYVPQDKLLEYPCHGAIFDPAHGAAVLAGPAFEPPSCCSRSRSTGTRVRFGYRARADPRDRPAGARSRRSGSRGRGRRACSDQRRLNRLDKPLLESANRCMRPRRRAPRRLSSRGSCRSW